MTSSTNCSFTYSNGTFSELLCTSSQYCCTGSDSNFCSGATCTSSSSSNTSDDDGTLTVLFWGILGGLFGTGLILIAVTYIICRIRAPNSCLSTDPLDEIFEETESHEIRTVTSETRRSSNLFFPTSFIRRESLWRLRTRRKSQRNVRITGITPKLVCVECGKTSDIRSSKRNSGDGQYSTTVASNITKFGGGSSKSTSKQLPDVAD